jgi:hypothetical protein
MLALVRDLRWKEVGAALAAQPGLVGFRDARGRNWLHLCCGVNPKQRGLGAAAAVRTAGVLLDAGLDIDQEAFHEGSWKATPLWYAVARGENLPLVRYLLGRGADPNHCLWAAAFRDDVAAIELLVRSGAEIDPVAEGDTPFLHAVRWSRFRAARALLEHGADVNFRNERRMTALHYVLKKGSDLRHLRMLIERGARGDLRNGDGVTAAEILMRRRAPGFRNLAKRLAARR